MTEILDTVMPPRLAPSVAEARRVIACPSCGASALSDNSHCVACGVPLPTFGADSSHVLAERRHLTVMFCDIVGSTALAARLDPQDFHDVIGAYSHAVAETVARFDGFVSHFMGDGVLACFGYPQAQGDDAERAVRAGLAMIKAVARLPVPEPIEIRVGIATGLAIVGAVVREGDLRLRPVLGETPNLAARLQAIATPGTIAVSTATRERIGDSFECLYLGAVELRGFADSRRAWLVLGEDVAEHCETGYTRAPLRAAAG